jgi:hypothetical protein
MNFGVWRGENPRDTGRYREDFQRGQVAKGAGLLMQTYGKAHEVRALRRFA